MASVELKSVTKVYGNGVKAVDSLDLDIADGEFMVLVGPSGCGKTTALRMVAGLEDITGGTVAIGGRVVNDVSPKDRDVAMVFQNYALYPHMTVAENIGFGLKLRRFARGDIRAKVATAATMLGLTKHLDRKPGQLSGGQRQRVAMGRAIVREPAVYLMDEPLSNLDAKLRVQMRAEVSRIQRQFGVTTVYVTHDQTEAMTMGDRVAVLRDGDLLQVAPPQQLYDHPANIFVAAFIGSPAMNLYQGTLSSDGTEVAIGSQPIPLPEIVQTTRPGLSAYRSGPIVIGIRPEDLSASKQLGPTIEGDVDAVETLGSELLVYFRIAAKRLHMGGADTADAEVIEDLGAGEVGAATMAAAVARIDRSVPVQPGRRQRFSVNPTSIHFFDVSSGAAIW